MLVLHKRLCKRERMGNESGMGASNFEISGDRVGSRLLQGVERRMSSLCPIPSDKQKRIDQILKELEESSNRMERILGVFNRINRGLWPRNYKKLLPKWPQWWGERGVNPEKGMLKSVEMLPIIVICKESQFSPEWKKRRNKKGFLQILNFLFTLPLFVFPNGWRQDLWEWNRLWLSDTRVHWSQKDLWCSLPGWWSGNWPCNPWLSLHKN